LSREFVREVRNALAVVAPSSKCGIVAEYFEKPSTVAVELRTKGQGEKEIGDKKGFVLLSSFREQTGRKGI
jgi:hypothetical protein